jgi:DNA-binding transcriptional regulator YdaS (Cro superfamily)
VIRAAILQALARPGAPKRSALARAVGLAPENLTHWLAGRRPIPQEKIEAMLVALDLVIVPRAG